MTGSANSGGESIGHEAFSLLMRQYYPRVYLAALSITRQHEMTEDIAQETFLRAWLRRDSLSNPAMQLQPWLVRIATNLSVDWLRRGQQRSRVMPFISLEEVMVDPTDSTGDDPRQAAAQAELKSQLAEAVMALPDDLRQPVLLHYGDDMTLSEIARINGEAPSTVKRRLDKARQLLRQHLESGRGTTLADSVKTLRPRPQSLARAMAIVTAASAAPAAAHTQLLRLVSDTPLPPSASSAISTAAAHTQEKMFMNSIIANTGVAKLVGGLAAAVALGSGIYAINDLTRRGRSGDAVSTTEHAPSARVIPMQAESNPRSGSYTRRGNANTSGDTPSATTNTGSSDSKPRRRLSPQERLALFTKDSISSQPQVVKRDGETTGLLYFNLEIIDESGLPIKGAQVQVEQILQSQRGSRDYGTTETLVLSDFKGIARVHVPRIFEEQVQTDGAIIEVEHPEYAHAKKVIQLNDIRKTVLQRGETLKVYAYDAASSTPLRSGVRPTLGPSVFKDLEWDWSSDGAMVIRKIAPDYRTAPATLSFYLKGETPDGDELISDYQNVKFPRTSDEPLHVTMRRSLTVTGALSPNVSRPVTAGMVMVTADSGGGMCGSFQSQMVGIKEDGTFTISELPPGKILIWALANGWCSVGIRTGGVAGIPQEFELTENNQPYILSMQQTATLELTVLDATGAPVPDLEITSYPNMFYEDCRGVWIRSATGKTDANGTAVLHDLPPLEQMSFQITSGDWEFPPRSTRSGRVDKTLAFDFKSGQTIHDTVTAYPRGTTTITQVGDQITTTPGQ